MKELGDIFIFELVGKTIFYWICAFFSCVDNFRHIFIILAAWIPFALVVKSNLHNIQLSMAALALPCIAMRVIGEKFYNRNEPSK